MHWERVVFVTLWCWVTCTSWLKFWVPSCHPFTCASLLDFDILPFYFDLSFSILYLFFLLMHFEQHTELDNWITMQHNLQNSAKGSNDAYDVTVSLTCYEPNDMVFNEVGNSQGSFSYVAPSSDLDIDDTTLGKLLTEAHREYADYRRAEGVSVSQSSLSVVFDRTGKPVGESSSNRTDWDLAWWTETNDNRRILRENWSSRTPSSSSRRRTPNSTRLIMPSAKGFSWSSSTKSYWDGGITKIPEFYLRYARKTELIEDQNTFMELSGRLQESENEVKCMNDSKDFQDAESVRSGNSHVTSQPMSFS